MFVRRQLFFLLKLPFLLLLVLARRRPGSELGRPLGELFRFLAQPKATLALSLAIVAVFVYELFVPETLLSLAFQPRHIIELRLAPIVASWFMHLSLAHLLGNLLFLYVFGRVVEAELGSAKLALVYFSSAIISTLIAAAFDQGGIGASGAIAGLIATAILLRPFYITYILAGIPLPILLLGWAAIIGDVTGLLAPRQSNIGYAAHIGGYAALTLLVWLLKSERARFKRGLVINLVFVLVMALGYLLLAR